MTQATVFEGYNTFTLLDHSITAAETAEVYGAANTGQALGGGANYLGLLAKFTYASDSATSVKAWVQTTFDGGTTWFDIANFAFTTSSLNKWCAVNANLAATHATPTDGTLADNSVNNGLIGTALRVKLTSVGTYGAGTSLKIYAVAKR